MYLANDKWWMQEKFDGKRLLVRKDADGITAINRKGLIVGLPQPISTAIAQIDVQRCLLDGEAVGDIYNAFDLLAKDELDLRKNSYATRYEQLVNLVDSAMTNFLRFAESATDAAAKAGLLDKLRRRKGEAVVFKDRTAPYTSGRPASGGAQVKLKFYATASCLVAGINRGKRSVALELLDGSKRIAVGNVTIPANQPIPQAGTIAEVRYLYAYPGGSLFQPVYLGRRDDIDSGACTIKQLKFKAGEEAEEG
jgi:bifunctional non-homologous end joining protein LigD